jgi:hypothetical protein
MGVTAEPGQRDTAPDRAGRGAGADRPLKQGPHKDGTSAVALVLCDASGQPVGRWTVQSDGTYSASVNGESAPGF